MANDLRLDMLEYLARCPNRCVKEIAEELGIADDVASKHLQVLAFSGFVMQKHVGKYLYYTLAGQGDLLGPALGLIKAVGKDHVIFMATATTHERRVKIIAALGKEPMEMDPLCIKTHISREAMKRQLTKLVRRGFVQENGGKFGLQKPDCVLGLKLIERASAEFTPAQV